MERHRLPELFCPQYLFGTRSSSMICLVRVLVYMLAVPLAWYLGTFNFNGYLDEIYGWNDCRQENQGNVDRLQRFSAAFCLV